MVKPMSERTWPGASAQTLNSPGSTAWAKIIKGMEKWKGLTPGVATTATDNDDMVVLSVSLPGQRAIPEGLVLSEGQGIPIFRDKNFLFNAVLLCVLAQLLAG